MAKASDHERAQEIATADEAAHPAPLPPLPTNPHDLDIADAIVFAARTVMWNMEEIFMGRTADKKNLPQRALESRVLSELNRTLDKLVRLHKSHSAEKVNERSDDDLKAELLEGFRKIADARGT